MISPQRGYGGQRRVGNARQLRCLAVLFLLSCAAGRTPGQAGSATLRDAHSVASPEVTVTGVVVQANGTAQPNVLVSVEAIAGAEATERSPAFCRSSGDGRFRCTYSGCGGAVVTIGVGRRGTIHAIGIPCSDRDVPRPIADLGTITIDASARKALYVIGEDSGLDPGRGDMLESLGLGVSLSWHQPTGTRQGSFSQVMATNVVENFDIVVLPSSGFVFQLQSGHEALLSRIKKYVLGGGQLLLTSKSAYLTELLWPGSVAYTKKSVDSAKNPDTSLAGASSAKYELLTVAHAGAAASSELMPAEYSILSYPLLGALDAFGIDMASVDIVDLAVHTPSGRTMLVTFRPRGSAGLISIAYFELAAQGDLALLAKLASLLAGTL